MKPTDRYFFHSFPRPKPDETPEKTIERALSILSFMKEVGLVLAPEIVEWDVSIVSRSGTEELKILQQRACFTELSVSELDQHSETFGPVALAFDIGHLRDAGALPVIYAPQGSEKLLSQLSTFAVRGAYHTIGVLEILERLENRSNPKKAMERGHPLQPDEKITLERRDPSSGKVVVENDVSLSSIHQILGHVGYRNIPFDHSVGVLRLLQHIFYPTDNAYTGDQLGYYRQREWRLVGGGLHYENRPLARNLTQSEQARLLAIDEQFWSRELDVDKTKHPRVGLAQIYDPAPNWKFFELVKMVIVPAEAEHRARSIAGDKVISIDQVNRC